MRINLIVCLYFSISLSGCFESKNNDAKSKTGADTTNLEKPDLPDQNPKVLSPDRSHIEDLKKEGKKRMMALMKEFRQEISRQDASFESIEQAKDGFKTAHRKVLEEIDDSVRDSVLSEIREEETSIGALIEKIENGLKNRKECTDVLERVFETINPARELELKKFKASFVDTKKEWLDEEIVSRRLEEHGQVLEQEYDGVLESENFLEKCNSDEIRGLVQDAHSRILSLFIEGAEQLIETGAVDEVISLIKEAVGKVNVKVDCQRLVKLIDKWQTGIESSSRFTKDIVQGDIDEIKRCASSDLAANEQIEASLNYAIGYYIERVLKVHIREKLKTFGSFNQWRSSGEPEKGLGELGANFNRLTGTTNGQGLIDKAMSDKVKRILLDRQFELWMVKSDESLKHRALVLESEGRQVWNEYLQAKETESMSSMEEAIKEEKEQIQTFGWSEDLIGKAELEIDRIGKELLDKLTREFDELKNLAPEYDKIVRETIEKFKQDAMGAKTYQEIEKLKAGVSEQITEWSIGRPIENQWPYKMRSRFKVITEGIDEHIEKLLNHFLADDTEIGTGISEDRLTSSVVGFVKEDKALKMKTAFEPANLGSIPGPETKCPPESSDLIIDGMKTLVEFDLSKCRPGSSYCESKDKNVGWVNLVNHRLKGQLGKDKKVEHVVEQFHPGTTRLIIPKSENECTSVSYFEKNYLQQLYVKKQIDIWAIDKSDPANALELGILLIGIFKNLHQMGYVYGNGDLVDDVFVESKQTSGLASIPEHQFRVVLGGLSKGRMYYENGKQVSPVSRCDMKEGKKGLSPGEIKGYCPTRADDMYRISELLIAACGVRLTFKEKHLPLEWIELKRNYKLTPEIVEKSMVYNPKNPELYDVINSFHDEMFKLSDERSETVPDYDEWIRKFGEKLGRH